MKRFPQIDGWCFAIVNGRLAEIFWRKLRNGERKVFAHGYVKRGQYKTRKEIAWINKETKKHRFSYRNKHYKLLEVTDN